MSKHTTRHYCRNTHCRAKLAAPVDNEHHAFCTSGCHAIFYRHRCLVCEDAMRRKRDDQRFKNGHKSEPSGLKGIIASPAACKFNKVSHSGMARSKRHKAVMAFIGRR